MKQPAEQLQELILQPLAPSKSNAAALAGKIAELVQSAHVNPLEAVIRLSATAEMIEKAKDHIFLDVMMEVEKHKGKAEINGCKINIKEAGVKYDYSSSQEWREIDAEIKKLTESRKASEEAMKRIPAGKVMVDTETGLTLEGAIKTSKTTYEVRLAK